MTDIMDRTGDMVDCDRFEELLPDYLDGSLSPSAAVGVEAHRASCASCAALATDLEGIRDAAGALPVIEPARDLWAGIEARIAAPVVSLEEARLTAARSGRRGAPRATAWPRTPWLAAAAALLLVAGTASVTYTVTTSRIESRATLAASTDAASTDAARPTPDAPTPDAPATTPAVVAATARPGDAPAAATAVPVPSGRAAGPGRVATGTLASERAPGAGSALEAAEIYDHEIAILRGILDQRRTTLDTGTVRVLETNLGIIDRAIRESREALLRDPASPLLNRQLTDALDEKLELMRTAVLVSSGAT